MEYCEDCDSYNIEILTDEYNMPIGQICNDCGSDKIGYTEEEDWDSYFE